MHALPHFSMLIYAGLTVCVHATPTDLPQQELVVPAQGLSVDLGSGIVSRNGFSDQCLESVSISSGNVLTVSRAPGDDEPDVQVNGRELRLETGQTNRARLGAMRLAPDGAFVHLRTWKTGSKQTELLINGSVRLTWPHGNTVRLLKASREALLLLVTDRLGETRLQRFDRQPDATVASPQTVKSFGACRVDRVRLTADAVWAQMSCGTQKGIFRSDLQPNTTAENVSSNSAAEFVSLVKKKGNPGGVPITIVTGSPAALHFYYAATGLLTSQTGEVRACMSDAEGLQSWNQSYRLRALGLLFEKTGAPVFARLAEKSMKLTLASQDSDQDANGFSCGWSSRIYVPGSENGQKLMINQAVIANALNDACNRLGSMCPPSARAEIRATSQCLVDAFQTDFEPALGLYRIGADSSFKHAGKIAPWNWQISFAALLSRQSDPILKERAMNIVDKFQLELSEDRHGGLWRYWPEAYYLEKGYRPAKIEQERFEDTGHAGISLMSLSMFRRNLPDEFESAVARRADFLLASGERTPRDLDGSGPPSQRWFPAGGWADFASKDFAVSYSEPVPSRRSADAIYAYASSFEPDADFELHLEIQHCTETCLPGQKWTYTSWQEFLSNNPLFHLSAHSAAPRLPDRGSSTAKQLKNHDR